MLALMFCVVRQVFNPHLFWAAQSGEESLWRDLQQLPVPKHDLQEGWRGIFTPPWVIGKGEIVLR